jgi:hypothetical protein
MNCPYLRLRSDGGNPKSCLVLIPQQANIDICQVEIV